jgi:beta-phosphoglucomutase-like phosphatase (HAD superfamily)
MCPSVEDGTTPIKSRVDQSRIALVNECRSGDNNGEVTERVGGRVYDAVVFDNDGVLPERTGTAVFRRAATAAFDSFDVTPAEETVDELLRGVDPTWVAETCERLGVDTEAFWRERDAQFARFQCREADAGRKPAYDDVVALEDLSIRLGVVSNNQDATIEHLFDTPDLHRHFETWYGREPTLESVYRKKPEPYYSSVCNYLPTPSVRRYC